MQSVGQQIRETRLRLGLTLEAISAKSRIPVKKLQAIEADDVKGIGSPFFYRSFVRQFAEHLKLDYATLSADVGSMADAMPQPLMPGEGDFGKGTKIAPMPVKGRGRSFRWLYSVGSLGVMLAACSSFYALWQNSKEHRLSSLTDLIHTSGAALAESSAGPPVPVAPSQRVHPAKNSPARHAADQRPAGATSLKQSDTVTDADSNTAVAADQANSEMRVELSALEPTWLSIMEDGKETFRGVLDLDKTKVLEGHETARIRTGNAGGLSCVFNGKSIGALGHRGQGRTVVFTKSNYEVLDASAHIALASYTPTGE